MPTLFPTLFENLGGATVTVTTEALLFALSNRLGSDYEEARLVLTAAERIGIILTEVPGRHRLGVVASTPVDPGSPAP